MLQIHDIAASYGPLEVLHGVSLAVAQGEIVALLGANGAGKTSILSVISGLLPIARGSILFYDKPIHGLSPDLIVKKGLIQVPEGRRIFPRLTVLENLEMGAYPVDDPQHRQQTLHRVWELFPRLAERRKQLGGTLSGGEQQMLAIGRGLMAGPHLLLLDEPSLGLAPIIVDTIFRTIQQIRKEGVTVLLVEQNALLSLEIADRAYVLETGHIVLEGTGKELLKNERVKSSYLGT
jgi:branched-chain amino acid transport system ATP-binding protein